MDAIEKTQLAVQAIAVIRAALKQPEDPEVIEVLELAKSFVGPISAAVPVQRS